MDNYIGIARLVLLVQCTSCCVSFPVFRPSLGALISAVDPVAVIALFGGTRFRADPVLVSLLNGESVFVRRGGHRALHLLGETH